MHEYLSMKVVPGMKLYFVGLQFVGIKSVKHFYLLVSIFLNNNNKKKAVITYTKSFFGYSWTPTRRKKMEVSALGLEFRGHWI